MQRGGKTLFSGAQMFRLNRPRKNSKLVIPRAWFARGIRFLLKLRKSRSLAPLGMTIKPTFAAPREAAIHED
jgi:hypothetical protein